MPKGAGQPANNFKSEAAPQVNGRFVSANHKIELHCPEATLAGSIKGVRAHRATYAAAYRPGSGGITAVGYVGTSPLLIRLQKIGAKDLSVLNRGVDLVLRAKPIRKRFLAAYLTAKCTSPPRES